MVLIGLACKNAILIVEFARDLEEQGRGIVEAAVEACRLRLRPILMTSFAFIAGVLPLVFASGAGAEVRHVMGVTVISGMLGVTFFGLFFTPVFYVVLRHMVEARKARRATAAGLRMTRPVPLLLLASALVTGCTVGPRYVEPETTLPERFDQDKETVAEAQPVSTLWTAFGSAELDALIQRALRPTRPSARRRRDWRRRAR